MYSYLEIIRQNHVPLLGQTELVSAYFLLLFLFTMLVCLFAGEQARKFFLQSGLPPPVLAEIW